MAEATEGCNIYHPLEFPCNSRQFTNETPCTETLSFHGALVRQELAQHSFPCSKGYPGHVFFGLVFAQAKTTVDEISQKSAAVGRNVDVLTFCSVVCRPTQQEAEDYLHWYANENADWDAVDNLMTLQGMHAQSFTKEALSMFRDRFAAGDGGFPLVGTPDHIVRQLALLSETGIAGTTLSSVDYATEFP